MKINGALLYFVLYVLVTICYLSSSMSYERSMFFGMFVGFITIIEILEKILERM